MCPHPQVRVFAFESVLRFAFSLGVPRGFPAERHFSGLALLVSRWWLRRPAGVANFFPQGHWKEFFWFSEVRAPVTLLRGIVDGRWGVPIRGRLIRFSGGVMATLRTPSVLWSSAIL